LSTKVSNSSVTMFHIGTYPHRRVIRFDDQVQQYSLKLTLSFNTPLPLSSQKLYCMLKIIGQ
jgi:hypothetical protein